jgi:TPR repeat protein
MLPLSLSTPLVKPQLSPATVRRLVGCGSIVSLLRYRLGLSPTMSIARGQKSLEVRCMNTCLTQIRKSSAVTADRQRQAGQCANACVSYQNALSFGDLPSTAWIVNYKVDGRLGVPADPETAFDLARMGKLNGDAGSTAIDSWIDMTKSRCDESAYWRANHNLNAFPSTCFADFARAYWMGTRQLSWSEAKFNSVGIKWNTLQMLIKAADGGLDRAMFDAGRQLVCNQVAFEAGLQDYWQQPLNDFPQAYLLFVGSANQGFPPAMRSLGDCFRNGWGVDKDLNEARKWYEQASDAGCDCTVELAELDKLPSVEIAEEMP